LNSPCITDMRGTIGAKKSRDSLNWESLQSLTLQGRVFGIKHLHTKVRCLYKAAHRSLWVTWLMNLQIFTAMIGKSVKGKDGSALKLNGLMANLKETFLVDMHQPYAVLNGISLAVVLMKGSKMGIYFVWTCKTCSGCGASRKETCQVQDPVLFSSLWSETGWYFMGESAPQILTSTTPSTSTIQILEIGLVALDLTPFKFTHVLNQPLLWHIRDYISLVEPTATSPMKKSAWLTFIKLH